MIPLDRRLVVLLVLLTEALWMLLSLPGCGEDSSSPGVVDLPGEPSSDSESSPYTPMAVGNYWTDLTGIGSGARKHVITGTLALDGNILYRFTVLDYYGEDDGWRGRWGRESEDEYYRYWDDGRLYEIGSANPFHEASLVYSVILPDEASVGDTLSVDILDQYTSDGDFVMVVLEAKDISVAVPAGQFDRCYSVRVTTMSAYKPSRIETSTYAYKVGWIHTSVAYVQARDDGGLDTLSTTVRELQDYQLQVAADVTLKAISTPVPADHDTTVHPNELIMPNESYEPPGWLDRYGDYIKYEDDDPYFDFDLDGSFDDHPSWIKWSTPYDHSVRFYDIYFGAGVDPPLIESDFVLRERNRYPVHLLPETTYSWRVDVKFARGGEMAEGPVWTFTTGPAIDE